MDMDAHRELWIFQAEYAKHRRMQCPVLFGISDNRLCISLRNYGWLKVFLQRFQFPVFEADANDLFAVHSKTQEAAAYVRHMTNACQCVRGAGK